MMLNIKTEIFIDSPNQCRITCDDKFLIVCLHEIVKVLGVSEVKDIQKNTFMFTVKDGDDIGRVVQQMQERSLPYCAEAARRAYFRSMSRFWLLWTVGWGLIEYTAEILDLLNGEIASGLVWGLCGTWLVLSSLRNYWKYKKLENGET